MTDTTDPTLDEELDGTATDFGGRAVHPASPLAGLARKREAAMAELHLDLAVPEYQDRLGVDLYIRYRPMSLATTTRLIEQARKSKSADRVANANAAAVASATAGIYFLDDDGEEHAFVAGGEDGPWPKFDPDVAATLGVPWMTPTKLVRDLFFTDDQVAATVTRLQTWSEGEMRERAEDDRGN